MSEENKETNEETTNETKESKEAEESQEPAKKASSKDEDVDVKKLRADLEKYKKTALESEKKLKAKEEEDLQKQQNWKKYAEIKANEAEELRSKLDNMSKLALNREKLTALEHFGVKYGIQRLEDLTFFNLSEELLVEETNTGKINVIGAEDAVKRLKAERPYLFKTKGSSINPNEPDSGHDSSSKNKIGFKELEKARLAAEKSGDYSSYEKIFKEYRKQNNH